MLQLRNDTPFQGALMLLPNADGVDTVYAVVKGTFVLVATPDGVRLSLSDAPLAVQVAPEYYGAPGTSSIRRPSDVSLEKAGTDVLVIGQAWAPAGRPTAVLDVSVMVGPVWNQARVYGDRVWERGGVGYMPTPPAPFLAVPLVWERAYGGRDRTAGGIAEESRNPVGTGFRTGEGLEPVEGLSLPNIEDPGAPLTSWSQRPAPVGFGPLDAYWEPRRSFAGTYDERWQSERAPYLPEDFDARFLQVAPPSLIVPGHLRGDEPVALRGLTADGVLQFHLPAVAPSVTYRLDDGRVERPALLDTVILEPDAGRVVLVWRAALVCDKKALRVREVHAALQGRAA
jgi:hypothetical protein